MFIDDEQALREWLVATLEPLCDAEPIALARYVLALVAKDKPLDRLRENCTDRLEVFFGGDTKDFVDQLFDVIRSRRYIPEGKKENVQPTTSDIELEPTDALEAPIASTVIRREEGPNTESTAIPTVTSAVTAIQPVKRRYSNRNHGNADDSNRYQSSSQKRSSMASPSTKRTHRSYSNSSRSSASSPPPGNGTYNKTSRHDSADTKTSDAHADPSFNNHPTTAAQSYNPPNYYPSYQRYDNPSSAHHQYNPEAPDLDYHPHLSHRPSSQQLMTNPQRTLVTIVTNAEPMAPDQRFRQHDSGDFQPSNQNGASRGMISAPSSLQMVPRTKRHVVTTSYPNDQRGGYQHDNQSNNDNRGRRRPWQKPNGPGSAAATLEIRKIPSEFNTIAKLNEHFSKFGTITNVQIAHDGSLDSALVAYATPHEAESAYKNPEPIFNNRFIKIFWHNPNKGQGAPNNADANPPPPPPPESRSLRKSLPTPSHTKTSWSKAAQPSATSDNTVSTAQRLKKRATIPPGPSIVKKEAAKKACVEIRRKKHDLLDEQIQQQRLLLKKFEAAETPAEKESIRSLMKQVDATIIRFKDSFQTVPVKAPAAPKMNQQSLLKQREQALQKQLERLRAKTSADMRRSIATTLENKIAEPSRATHDEIAPSAADDEDHLLVDHDKPSVADELDQPYDEVQLLDS